MAHAGVKSRNRNKIGSPLVINPKLMKSVRRTWTKVVREFQIMTTYAVWGLIMGLLSVAILAKWS